MEPAPVILAGATGDLGGRLARALRARGVPVRALVRPGAAPADVAALRAEGVETVEADYARPSDLARACEGAASVVSALSGLRDVVVGAQTALLDAAVAAGVPRFIPSDFAADFTTMARGTNRNLDLRREFRTRLDSAPLAATSVLSGMFTDLLTGQAPILLFRFRRVVYWGDPDQPLDFTTRDDTARYTAAVALDPSTPRFLRIAGDTLSARGLAAAATESTGRPFRLFRAGGLRRLERLIALTRRLAPGEDDVYPPWQGMQYLHTMFSGRAVLHPLDNDRYPQRWTTVREVLAAHHARQQAEG
ncbi:MAG TPA: NmrA family NAD(P)-binding protein [Rhodothermales bacterium]|nr:NmrA family NAD(P)-binding protein [Rhodothermales bacterium]